MTDIIGDTLARLQNGIAVGHETVSVKKSSFVKSLLIVLEREKMIIGFNENKDQNGFEVLIRYKDGEPYVSRFKRISKPGQRIYVKSNDIIPVMNGRGVAIISTPQGVLSGAVAKVQGIGGEYLCQVW